MISLVLPLIAKLGVPERFQRIAAWAALIIAAIALLASAKAIYDRSVIADHEKYKTVESIEARDKAAEERAADTIRNADAERQREEAIRTAPNAGATVAPSTRALNCKRIEKAYTKEQLERITAYQERCR